jgi:hypothetical protein
MKSLLLAALLLSVANAAVADPKTDYLLYCRGCHLANGRGVPPVVPTLVDQLGRLLAVPGGREYLVRVPGVSQTPMDNQRLASVLNWVMTEFNADTLPGDFKPYSDTEVGKARVKVLVDPLRYRATLLGKQGPVPVSANPSALR